MIPSLSALLKQFNGNIAQALDHRMALLKLWSSRREFWNPYPRNGWIASTAKIPGGMLREKYATPVLFKEDMKPGFYFENFVH